MRNWIQKEKNEYHVWELLEKSNHLVDLSHTNISYICIIILMLVIWNQSDNPKELHENRIPISVLISEWVYSFPAGLRKDCSHAQDFAIGLVSSLVSTLSLLRSGY